MRVGQGGLGVGVSERNGFGLDSDGIEIRVDGKKKIGVGSPNIF